MLNRAELFGDSVTIESSEHIRLYSIERELIPTQRLIVIATAYGASAVFPRQNTQVASHVDTAVMNTVEDSRKNSPES